MHQETQTTTSSEPRSPQELMSRFGQYVAARDLEALLALYEPAAVFAPRPEVVHTGRLEIGGALAEHSFRLLFETTSTTRIGRGAVSHGPPSGSGCGCRTIRSGSTSTSRPTRNTARGE